MSLIAPDRTPPIAVSPLLVAAEAALRRLPLFFAPRPATPLRVLCIIAFDALHTLRHGRPLTSPQVRTMASLLDLGALANAQLDGKRARPCERHRILKTLRENGMASTVADYLRRLRHIERHRPPAGNFDEVRLYRESVVRLALALLATSAEAGQLDAHIASTHRDTELGGLFRLAMQCQILDDLLDYRRDRAANLPTFLTACNTLPEALRHTRRAAQTYANAHPPLLRVPLVLVSLCVRVALAARRIR